MCLGEAFAESQASLLVKRFVRSVVCLARQSSVVRVSGDSNASQASPHARSEGCGYVMMMSRDLCVRVCCVRVSLTLASCDVSVGWRRLDGEESVLGGRETRVGISRTDGVRRARLGIGLFLNFVYEMLGAPARCCRLFYGASQCSDKK